MAIIIIRTAADESPPKTIFITSNLIKLTFLIKNLIKTYELKLELTCTNQTLEPPSGDRSFRTNCESIKRHL